MKLTEMKMTVTLEENEIKGILADYVAKETGRAVFPSDVKINVDREERGDQRDSYFIAKFKNVTVDVKGK